MIFRLIFFLFNSFNLLSKDCVKPEMPSEQEWDKWLNEGIIDFVVPMNYYKEIHDWIVGLVTEKDEGVRKERDMVLQILSSHNNVIAELQFVNAIPINLSSLPFDVSSTDVIYLVANVTFQFDYFKFVTKGV